MSGEISPLNDIMVLAEIFNGLVVVDDAHSTGILGKTSTSLPSPVVSAALASLKVIRDHPELRTRVLENARLIKREIRDLGFNTTSEDTPIIPVFFRSYETAEKLSGFLKENNIIVPLINYPVNIDNYLVRITASVNHTDDQIGDLLNVFKKYRNK